MNNIAICVYTDDPTYRYETDTNLKNLDYSVFFDYNPNLYRALMNVSVKKRLFETEKLHSFDICIAYNPIRANLDNLILKKPQADTVYHAYGHFNREQHCVGAEPSLFYSRSVEFNRACEFIENYPNINDSRVQKMSEKFIFHIRSLHLKNECFNYENSSLFIRPA